MTKSQLPETNTQTPMPDVKAPIDIEGLKKLVVQEIEEKAAYNGWTSSSRERDMSIAKHVVDYLYNNGMIAEGEKE